LGLRDIYKRDEAIFEVPWGCLPIQKYSQGGGSGRGLAQGKSVIKC
jgi:hypothetical protein